MLRLGSGPSLATSRETYNEVLRLLSLRSFSPECACVGTSVGTISRWHQHSLSALVYAYREFE